MTRRLLRNATFVPSAENVGSVSVCGPLATAGKRLPLAPLTSRTFLPSSYASCGAPAETTSLILAPASTFVPGPGSVRISSPFFFAENSLTFTGHEAGVGGRLRRLGDRPGRPARAA